uniref:Uncharacterized protein n=1 Tax=Rhizophora mucronata TaxID=61149 RepID=A0A2P2QN87_RHIMU
MMQKYHRNQLPKCLKNNFFHQDIPYSWYGEGFFGLVMTL